MIVDCGLEQDQENKLPIETSSLFPIFSDKQPTEFDRVKKVVTSSPYIDNDQNLLTEF